MLKKPILSYGLMAMLLLALCSPIVASEVLRFEVYLDDKPIGEHSFRISEAGGTKRVSSSAAFDNVEVGSRTVSATRYALKTDKLTIDIWYNDALGWVGLSSDTGKGRRLIYRRL